MAEPDEIPDIVQRGYVLAYSPRSGDFNVNVMGLAAAFFFLLTFLLAMPALLIPAVAALCMVYYYYPLKERIPRIGAGQYGLFIDGLGLLSWRMIKDIEKVSYTSRLAQTHELHIHLSVPLEQALLADWRNLPIWRLLMKLPWHMKKDEVIRIPLEPFEPKADEIRSKLLQIWDYCR
jgi:hypothetical protein